MQPYSVRNPEGWGVKNWGSLLKNYVPVLLHNCSVRNKIWVEKYFAIPDGMSKTIICCLFFIPYPHEASLILSVIAGLTRNRSEAELDAVNLMKIRGLSWEIPRQARNDVLLLALCG